MVDFGPLKNVTFVQAAEGIDRLLMDALNAWQANICGNNGTYLLGYDPLPA